MRFRKLDMSLKDQRQALVLSLIHILLTISGFKVYDQMYMITQGGPGTATMTLVYYIYNVAFVNTPKYGYASAIAMVLFVLVPVSYTHLAVVGGQLPCTFLAECPYGIGNGVQKAPFVLHALGTYQCTQPCPAGEISCFPCGTPPGAGKIQPEGQRQGRKGRLQRSFSGLQKALLCPQGQRLPCSALFGRGKGLVIGKRFRQKGKLFLYHKSLRLQIPC